MAHRMRRLATLITLFSILGLLIVACGGGNQTGAEQGAQTTAATGGNTAATTAPATGGETTATEAPQTGGETAATTAPMMEETVTTGAMMEETVTAGGMMAETATAGGMMEETATAGGMMAETATAAGGAEATTTAGGGAVAALPAECTNVQLAYWNPFTGPDGPFMGEMTTAFNEANPNIVVEMTSQPEYYTQIETAAAAQQLPDVAIMHADQVATWAFRNVIQPVDELVGQIGISAGDYPEGVWNAGEVAGKRYSIPLDIHPMTMFYNEDLLKSAGLNAPPTNREEFEAAAQAMTQGDNKGFMITAGFPVQQIFSMLLHQYGGTWFNEDGTEAAWNSEAGVQALQWMKDAQSKYSEPNLEVDAELNAFKGGTVGMIWNGIWQTTNVTGEGVEFAGRATAVPQIGPQAATWAGSHQFVLPAKQEQDPCKAAAIPIFIKYMIDNSVTWARAGQIPANNTVRNSADFKAVEPQASIAPSVEAAIFPPAVPGITDAFAPLEQAVTSIMSGNATDIKAALDEAATTANQILQENQQRYGEAPGSTQ